MTAAVCQQAMGNLGMVNGLGYTKTKYEKKRMEIINNGMKMKKEKKAKKKEERNERRKEYKKGERKEGRKIDGMIEEEKGRKEGSVRNIKDRSRD